MLGTAPRAAKPRPISFTRPWSSTRSAPTSPCGPWRNGCGCCSARYANLDTELTERLAQAFLQPIFATAQVDTMPFRCSWGSKRRGVKTGIVSNTPWGSPGRVWRSELARHELATAVDAVVFCRDVGWRKPHPTPFRRALELIGVAAKDAAFVGDNPVWDVEGAESAGLLPILLGGRHPLHMSGRAIIAPTLPDVLATVDQLNSTANTGPQPMLA